MSDILTEAVLMSPDQVYREVWVKEKVAYSLLTLYKSGFLNPSEQSWYSKSKGHLSDAPPVFPLQCDLRAGCVPFWIKQLGPQYPLLIFGTVAVKDLSLHRRETLEERHIRRNTGYTWGRIQNQVFHTSTGPARRTRHDGMVPDGFVLKAAGQAYELALDEFRRWRAILFLETLVQKEIDKIGLAKFKRESERVALRYGERYERMPYGAVMGWIEFFKWRHIDRLDVDLQSWIDESEEGLF